MAFEMVDTDDRHTPAQRQRLGRRDADQQRAHQPRTDVTATASRSRPATPASSNAFATTPGIGPVWARLASSGTTPPKTACRSFSLATTEERTTSASSTTAAAVVARRLYGQQHRAHFARAFACPRPCSST